jgi:hypothetical protein
LLFGDVCNEFLGDSVIGKKPDGRVAHIGLEGVGRKAKEKEAVLFDACHSDALTQGNEELIDSSSKPSQRRRLFLELSSADGLPRKQRSESVDLA